MPRGRPPARQLPRRPRRAGPERLHNDSPEQFLATLAPTSGRVTVGKDLATLNVPDSSRFIGPESSKRLLVDAWGNPPAVAERNQGNRYADYREGVDPKASFGIAGLIAGAAAAEAGLFKGLWLAILGLKKVLIVVVAAVAGFFKKIFGRKTPRAGGATG